MPRIPAYVDQQRIDPGRTDRINFQRGAGRVGNAIENLGSAIGRGAAAVEAIQEEQNAVDDFNWQVTLQDIEDSEAENFDGLGEDGSGRVDRFIGAAGDLAPPEDNLKRRRIWERTIRRVTNRERSERGGYQQSLADRDIDGAYHAYELGGWKGGDDILKGVHAKIDSYDFLSPAQKRAKKQEANDAFFDATKRWGEEKATNHITGLGEKSSKVTPATLGGSPENQDYARRRYAVNKPGDGQFATLFQIETSSGTHPTMISRDKNGGPIAAGPMQLKVKPEKKSGISAAREWAKRAGIDYPPLGATPEEEAAWHVANPEESTAIARYRLGELNAKYGDDEIAVAIAYHSGEGPADKYVKTGSINHLGPFGKDYVAKYQKLRPKNADTRQGEVLVGGQKIDPAAGEVRMVGATGNNDQSKLSPDVMAAAKALSSMTGVPIKVTSGYRSSDYNKKVGGAKGSQHTHGQAIDIDISGMTDEEKIKLFAMATKAGFTGKGVYGSDHGMLHLDLGPERHWDYGPKQGRGATRWLPAALKAAQHYKDTGQIGRVRVSTARRGGTDIDLALSATYRPRGAGRNVSWRTRRSALIAAQSEQKRQDQLNREDFTLYFNERQSNRVAQLATTGTTNIPEPTDAEYEQVLGAKATPTKIETLQRERRALEAAKRESFSFRQTATNDEILDRLDQLQPDKNSPTYAADVERFAEVEKAGKDIINGRMKNPAQWAMANNPKVQAAFDAAQQDPNQMPEARQELANAQTWLPASERQMFTNTEMKTRVEKLKDEDTKTNEKISFMLDDIQKMGTLKQQQAALNQYIDNGAPSEFVFATMRLLDDENRYSFADAGTILDASDYTKNVKRSNTDKLGESWKKTIDETYFRDGQVGDVAFPMMRGSARSKDMNGKARQEMYSTTRYLTEVRGMDFAKAHAEAAKVVLNRKPLIKDTSAGVSYNVFELHGTSTAETEGLIEASIPTIKEDVRAALEARTQGVKADYLKSERAGGGVGGMTDAQHRTQIATWMNNLSLVNNGKGALAPVMMVNGEKVFLIDPKTGGRLSYTTEQLKQIEATR